MIVKKTKEERVQEVLDVRRKLNNMGYKNTHDEIKRLFRVLSEYVVNGEYRKDRFVITGYDKIIDKTQKTLLEYEIRKRIGRQLFFWIFNHEFEIQKVGVLF